MKIIKAELLESLFIAYDSSGKRWRSNAEIRIDNYVIKIETKYYDELDKAVEDIKKRVIDAIQKFYLPKK
ncbi:MAG: hypothetical protein Unbinned5350contig1001_11 [Prokaryotic dsDNA virus sp.]|nr:MAG: hypothetical protein Unbinned5350contig1001_11 [Prokaryotic dsDNA virus sp.]|tara:strand:- start:29521 stop:29730 length:210 start_codon:yes stop_codon:yes gene_type:complete